MPFTISHAAVVLPFARPLARWRLLSAALIGSMVPDFGFLMTWRPPRVETHSALGLVTFCLPVGLASFWIFQRLVKTPLLAVLPDGAYARWHGVAQPADIRSLKQWGLAALGVLGGAVTHLVWDAFTHEGARGIRMIPMLVDPVVDIAGHRLVGARLWQDVSSIVGLAIVLAIVAYGLRPAPELAAATPRVLQPRERRRWILGYVALALFLAACFVIVKSSAGDPAGHALSTIVGVVAIAVLRGFAAALVLQSLCLTVRLRHRT
jgi:hypothetical protein